MVSVPERTPVVTNPVVKIKGTLVSEIKQLIEATAARLAKDKPKKGEAAHNHPLASI